MNAEKDKESRPIGWTTLEEGKRLIEAGLDPDTADLHYAAFTSYSDGCPLEKVDYRLIAAPYRDRTPFPYEKFQMDFVPCWTIGALVELFPTDYESNNDRCVNIARRMKSKYYPAGWQLYFIGPVDRKLHSVEESNLIEGVVKTMLLCLEHGLVKKGSQKMIESDSHETNP